MFNSEHMHSCFRTVNNATLLAGFASFCIMAIELDARAALQPVLDQAEARYHTELEDELYEVQYGTDMADQGDEDRFADYNYDPADDICYGCGKFFCECGMDDDDDEQDKLEAIWYRRELEDAY